VTSGRWPRLRRSGWPSARPSLSPGDKVTHDAYGLGTVLSVEGRGDDPEAKIDFGGEYGIKHLVLRYAPIEKL
jgi:DNA helicase-2/ATP-dependent DNA helicase PcrA